MKISASGCLMLVVLAGCTDPTRRLPRDGGVISSGLKASTTDLGSLPVAAGSNAIWMSPEPFSSAVAVSSTLTFTVDLGSSVNSADVEASIALRARGGQSVAGWFSWHLLKT